MIVCIKCKKRMSLEKISTLTLLENEDENILWFADVYECSECGAQVASSFAPKPFWRGGKKQALPIQPEITWRF